jgi:hypothetical protein
MFFLRFFKGKMDISPQRFLNRIYLIRICKRPPPFKFSYNYNNNSKSFAGEGMELSWQYLYVFVSILRKFNYIAEFQEEARIKPKLIRRTKSNCTAIPIKYAWFYQWPEVCICGW